MMMARRAGGSAVRRGTALRRPMQARWRRQDGFGGPTGEESGAGGPAGYAAFALRWWWLIAACVLIGGGGAYAYTRFGPVPYQSTALVLAPQQPDSTGGGQRSASASKNTAENYAAQASSQRVFDLAVRALDGKLPEGRRITVRDLLLMVRSKTLEVRQQRESNVVSIAVTDTNPRVAHLLADTVAGVFVQDVNDRTREQVDEHRTQLEQQIELTRQQLITSQLRQQEKDLGDQLHDERTQLLQLQQQYQGEIQRQAEMDRLVAGMGQQPAPSAATGSTPSGTAVAERQALLRQQQQGLERSIADVSAQLADVRAALSALTSTSTPLAPAAPFIDGDAAPSTPEVAVTGAPSVSPELTAARREVDRLAQLQAQRKDLALREDTLSKQIADLDQQLRLVLQQYQQEVQRQFDAAREPLAARPAATPQPTTAAQQRQADELATAVAQANAERLKTLTQQRDTLQQRIATLNAQLSDVRTSLSQLPSDQQLAAAAAAAQGQLQAQLDEDQRRRLRDQQDAQQQRDQRSQLQQREQALSRQIDDQRGQLRQVQLQQVQELDRQVQSERDRTQSATTGAPPPEQQARLQELASAAAATRLEWLRATSEQQKEVEHNVADLSGRLAAVRAALAERPTNQDPLLDAAFASAYKERLQDLTAEYVRGQINTQSATKALIRYGDASIPLPTLNYKRSIALGLGGGLAAGAGLAYALDLLLSQRRARARAQDRLRPVGFASLPPGTARTASLAPALHPAPPAPPPLVSLTQRSNTGG